jgi:hypothetical protein
MSSHVLVQVCVTMWKSILCQKKRSIECKQKGDIQVLMQI